MIITTGVFSFVNPELLINFDVKTNIHSVLREIISSIIFTIFDPDISTGVL